MAVRHYFSAVCFLALVRSAAVSYTHLYKPGRALLVLAVIIGMATAPVSYTHLDVYKRQL